MQLTTRAIFCYPAVQYNAQDGDLKILVSAVRLVHRTLAATPPAAAAVGLSGSPRQSRRKALSYTKTAASVSVDRRLGLDDGPEVREAPPSKGKGKGKKRGRSELGGDVGVDRMSQDEDSGEDSRRSSRKSGSRVHRSTGNPAADAASASTGGTAFPSGTSTVAETTTKTALESSIFVAGKPITAADIPVIQGNAWCSKTTQDRIPDRGVAGGGDQTVREGTGRRDRVGTANEGWPWAGTKGVEDLARRVKDRLVVWFHRGAIAGGSALVEACLQVGDRVHRVDLTSFCFNFFFWNEGRLRLRVRALLCVALVLRSFAFLGDIIGLILKLLEMRDESVPLVHEKRLRMIWIFMYENEPPRQSRIGILVFEKSFTPISKSRSLVCVKCNQLEAVLSRRLLRSSAHASFACDLYCISGNSDGRVGSERGRSAAVGLSS